MSSFIKNVSELTFSSIFAQGLGILIAPFLTRLFAPEAFGIAGIFASITSIMSIFTCFRYELALVLPDRDEQAENLLAGTLLLSICTSGISVLLIYFFKKNILNALNSMELGEYIWFIPPMCLMIGVFAVANYWNTRKRKFKRLSIIKVINSLSTNSIKLAMGLCGYASGGILIGATIIGQFIANLLLWPIIWRSDKETFKAHIKIEKIILALKKFKRFPQYVIWSGLLVDFSMKLPVFFIAYFFSSKELGFFVMTQSVLKAPLNILGQAISQVFYQKAASINQNINNLSVIIENTFNFLLSFSLLPILILSVFGKDFISLLFGSNWNEAGIYAQIFSFSLLVEFSSAPMGSLFNVLGKQKEALFFNILLMLFRLLFITVGIFTGNIYYTIIFFVLGDILGRSLKFYYIFNISGFSIKKIILNLFKTLGYASPFLIIILATNFLLTSNPITILLQSTLFIIIYYFLIIKKTDIVKKL